MVRRPAVATVSVRWASERDAHAIGQLVQVGLDAAPSAEIERDEVTDDALRLGEDTLDVGRAQVLVAEEGGFIAGAARVSPREFVRSQHVGEVQVLVHPSVRRRGIGRRLLAGLDERVARDMAVRKLAARVAEDDGALEGLLRAAGWRLERIERGALRRDGRDLDVRVMARYLDPRMR